MKHEVEIGGRKTTVTTNGSPEAESFMDGFHKIVSARKELENELHRFLSVYNRQVGNKLIFVQYYDGWSDNLGFKDGSKLYSVQPMYVEYGMSVLRMGETVTAEGCRRHLDNPHLYEGHYFGLIPHHEPHIDIYKVCKVEDSWGSLRFYGKLCDCIFNPHDRRTTDMEYYRTGKYNCPIALTHEKYVEEIQSEDRNVIKRFFKVCREIKEL